MRALKCSAQSLAVRSKSGAVAPQLPRFTSGLVADIGIYVPVSDDEVIAAALRLVAQQLTRVSVLTKPDLSRAYVVLRLAGLEHEVFCCIYLDNRNRVIACDELFRGTVDGTSVHPREVVKEALKRNAAAVIFAHNHPSGVAEPSPADELITRRLKEALALVDIRVLDHLVVGELPPLFWTLLSAQREGFLCVSPSRNLRCGIRRNFANRLWSW